MWGIEHGEYGMRSQSPSSGEWPGLARSGRRCAGSPPGGGAASAERSGRAPGTARPGGGTLRKVSSGAVTRVQVRTKAKALRFAGVLIAENGFTLKLISANLTCRGHAKASFLYFSTRCPENNVSGPTKPGWASERSRSKFQFGSRLEGLDP